MASPARSKVQTSRIFVRPFNWQIKNLIAHFALLRTVMDASTRTNEKIFDAFHMNSAKFIEDHELNLAMN